MMALQLKTGDAAYYQSADYCRNYTSPPVSYGDSSHYFARLPGPETMLKPPLSLFSHHHQPFHHMDSLHRLGPPPMAPTQPLGPPPMSPAQAMGPPTLVPAQSLCPPPITAAPPHTLRPPSISPPHSLGPPPQTLGPPPMVHTLLPPPVDLSQTIVPPTMDLTQQLGPPPPLSHSQTLVPPPVVAPGVGRFPLPPSPLSSPPALGPDPSQMPPRLPGQAPIPAQVSCLIPGGPLPGQAAPASEQPQDEGSPLGVEEQEDSLGLGDLCKPLYCKLCNVTLNSAQQAQAHYQGKNHGKKLRNFYAGSQQPPAIRIPEVLEGAGQTALSSGSNDSDAGRQALYKGATRVILATENDYCKLCDASFSSPAVAQAHYQGKNHAKKLRLAEAQQNANNMEGNNEAAPRRSRKDCSEYRLVKNRRSPQLPASMTGPYYNPRPRQRIPRDLAMCVTPSGQFYCSMCNCGAEQETDFRQHLESKQHKAKVSELRYRHEMENLGYS
ncbi:zinc finger matrin-type protein 3 isoform X1 [Labrus mixtus]|uniref:zinc finger matrin-type protein 3 isoform X1 n=1 Tax=Labrus mixtus TaxID=508554 RepID=UPI0029BFDB79|nr:zinc finger matrin-type protein 3 isoform X1 [Labrus mixtus]